jgi:hypothetical protein
MREVIAMENGPYSVLRVLQDAHIKFQTGCESLLSHYSVILCLSKV